MGAFRQLTSLRGRVILSRYCTRSTRNASMEERMCCGSAWKARWVRASDPQTYTRRRKADRGDLQASASSASGRSTVGRHVVDTDPGDAESQRHHLDLSGACGVKVGTLTLPEAVSNAPGSKANMWAP